MADNGAKTSAPTSPQKGATTAATATATTTAAAGGASSSGPPPHVPGARGCGGLTTLSTSTSSFEALDPHDPQLNHLASLMFSKTSEWIQGELESTAEEYKLLEQMNKVTATKYSDMRQITTNVARGVEQLNEKYRELQPYLEQIDQIEESVARLETAAFKLDSYSKRLEAKFKALEARNS